MGILLQVKHLTLFKDFSNQDLAAILSQLETKTIKPGGILFREGETSEGLYAVTDGSLELMIRLAAGNDTFREQSVTTLEVGDIFCELGFLADNVVHPCSCRSLEGAQIVFFPRLSWERLRTQSPVAALRFMESVTASIAAKLTAPTLRWGELIRRVDT